VENQGAFGARRRHQERAGNLRRGEKTRKKRELRRKRTGLGEEGTRLLNNRKKREGRLFKNLVDLSRRQGKEKSFRGRLIKKG